MADLITVSQYKDYEGIAGIKQDLRLSQIIPSVSQLVKTYCGNSIVDFYSTNKTETFSIDWNTHIVQLTESPVNTIVSVSERDSYSAAYTTLTTTDHEYYLDTATDSIIRTNSSGGQKFWPKGVGAVQVVYTAGYSAVPEDLKLAVIDLVTFYLKDEHKERKTLGVASIQNPGSSSQNNSVAFPDHIKRVLDLYKNF